MAWLVKTKVKSMLIIFFDIKGFAKNSSWQAKQPVPHTTVTFYGDCVKMCEEFASNFGDKITGCCISTPHHLTLPFFTREFLTKTTLMLSPNHYYYLYGEGVRSPIDSQMEYFYLSAAHNCSFSTFTAQYLQAIPYVSLGRAIPLLIVLNVHVISESFVMTYWIVTSTCLRTREARYTHPYTCLSQRSRPLLYNDGLFLPSSDLWRCCMSLSAKHDRRQKPPRKLSVYTHFCMHYCSKHYMRAM
jgi:hypothetical protein